jgi:uncharacterized protein YcbK (DUF882 family)
LQHSVLVIAVLGLQPVTAISVQTLTHPSGIVSHAPRANTKKDRAALSEVALRESAPTVASVHLHECVVADRAAMVQDQRAGFGRIDWLLRDRTSWQVLQVHRGTLATMLETARRFQSDRVEVISGFRSPKMNEMLRKKGRHVAQRSQHPLGTAVDFRLLGVPMAPVFLALEATHNGGVGRYRDDAFVHVDAGPRRRWRGE